MKLPGCGSDSHNHTLRYLKIAALLCGAAILFSGCVNDIEKIKAFNPSEILPVVYAEDFETTYSDSGMVRFYLKTPELKRFESDGTSFIEFPKGILLVKYNARREMISSISARYAKQFVREKRWEARNDVVAVNSKGDTLKTEHLVWDENAKKIYNDEYVKIISPDQVITGVGFESDASLENWRIRNPRGNIYVKLNRESSPQGDSLMEPLPSRGPVNIGNQ
ncbi:MAG TPA: LPS export ABC transporter periplasmic protein LptC [Prolixibacteraceae bacterium]|mgnify:FL=1|jgi:LPS export ABC transporter protein LptC|nr:LPS export ABC transporter periplasmic protein LptC [Bacteroidales bacterium]HNZ69466.1 LPS export ABC transporter periplasmic protein LptC [Prolixibacteraceae bacterium]HOC86519.1 LPS export ABC transporter periplasmic protein LptC [Prolixibacteraceae bacterium]HOG96197.1 LPS export ABC transporter periplasmic protein LptC [Prolixibacteraceae bacterium]HOY92690.1 LPS export ABC transporter periplasmic protein LptC [Prolixibacteraceae bacterium]